MMGHCSNQALIRLLRASMADKKVIAAAQHFRCPSCDEVKKTEQPRETRPLRPDHQLRFNHEVSIDVFEVHDCREGRHAILSMWLTWRPATTLQFELVEAEHHHRTFVRRPSTLHGSLHLVHRL